MYIIFLKFGANRSQASQWASAHMEWIQRGIASGDLLLAGSLENAQGGVVLAAQMSREALTRWLDDDPFVAHSVVTAEIHSVTPSRMADGMAALLDSQGV